MTASPASSHTQEEQRMPKLISTPPSAVGSYPSEEQPKRLEGLPHDIYYRITSDAETSSVKHKQKTADNIEIPAKDDNITGGNSFTVLTCSLK